VQPCSGEVSTHICVLTYILTTTQRGGCVELILVNDGSTPQEARAALQARQQNGGHAGQGCYRCGSIQSQKAAADGTCATSCAALCTVSTQGRSVFSTRNFQRCNISRSMKRPHLTCRCGAFDVATLIGRQVGISFEGDWTTHLRLATGLLVILTRIGLVLHLEKSVYEQITESTFVVASGQLNIVVAKSTASDLPFYNRQQRQRQQKQQQRRQQQQQQRQQQRRQQQQQQQQQQQRRRQPPAGPLPPQ